MSLTIAKAKKLAPAPGFFTAAAQHVILGNHTECTCGARLRDHEDDGRCPPYEEEMA